MLKIIKKNHHKYNNVAIVSMFKRRAFLEPCITKKAFWTEIEKELLNYYPKYKVKEILRHGQILSLLTEQPVESKRNGSYNYNRKKKT